MTKDLMTEAETAVELDINRGTLRNLRLEYADDPSVPTPEKLGRDALWTRDEREAFRVWLEEYRTAPTARWVCAQCRRFTSNNRKLHLVGDCRIHGRQVPITQANFQYRGPRDDRDERKERAGWKERAERVSRRSEEAERRRALAEIDAVTTEAENG